MWIAHVVFSPCGETAKVAAHFHEKTGGFLYDFTDPKSREDFDRSVRYDLAVFHLPVYGEDVPLPMKPVIAAFNADRFVFSFTYGRKTWGDAPSRAAALVGCGRTIGYSVLPARHAYSEDEVAIDFAVLAPLVEKINGGDLTPIALPKRRLRPADLFPKTRARINYAVAVDLAVCVRCGDCIRGCPVRAIAADYEIGRSCIGCAKCARICPVHAIRETKSPFLVGYLRRRKTAAAVVVTR